MKKTNSLSKNKFIIIVNLFLISILMVVGVYAWFASQANNRVDAYDIQVQSDNSLELSFDQETWNGTLNLSDLKRDDGTSVLDTMKFVEVTGNGQFFNIPQLIQKSNYAEVNTTGQWTVAEANKDYLQFTVHMRSKDKLEVYLSSESKAAPSSTVFTGTNCGNPTTYASGANAFSKDCIVGALRVAAKNSSGTQKFIWITNPEFHLNNTIGSNTYSMDTSAYSGKYSTNTSPAEGSNYYWNDPYAHYFYSNSSPRTVQTYAAGSTVIAGQLPDSVSTKPTSNKTLLATLSGTKDADGYYNSYATITVWIEGCDTEARRALVDGKFNLSLLLDSYGIA